jgi:hypothetical protein
MRVILLNSVHPTLAGLIVGGSIFVEANIILMQAAADLGLLTPGFYGEVNAEDGIDTGLYHCFYRADNRWDGTQFVFEEDSNSDNSTAFIQRYGSASVTVLHSRSPLISGAKPDRDRGV